LVFAFHKRAFFAPCRMVIGPGKFLFIFLTFGTLPLAAGKKGKSGSKSHTNTDAAAALVSHIKCQVCEIGVQQARRQARNKSIEGEDRLTDFVENLCSMRQPEGRWLTRLDITQRGPTKKNAPEPPPTEEAWPWNWVSWAKGLLGLMSNHPKSKLPSGARPVTADDPLTVVLKEETRECHNECTAVQKACQSSIKEEKLVEMLMKSEGVSAMRQKICKKACGKRWDELPRLEYWMDEPFKPAPLKTSHKVELKLSPGDLEAMAARENIMKERQARPSAEL